MGCGVSKDGAAAAPSRSGGSGSMSRPPLELKKLNKELHNSVKSQPVEGRQAKITWGHIPKMVARMSIDFSAQKHQSRHRHVSPTKRSLKKTGSMTEQLRNRLKTVNSVVLRKQYTAEETELIKTAEQIAAEQEWEELARGIPGSEPRDNVLFQSAQSGHVIVLQGVLEALAQQDVAVPGGHAAVALCAAAFNGQLEAAKLLLDNAGQLNFDPTTALDELENTPLKLCAAEGHTEVLKLLLETGIDVSKAATSGKTALMAAAEGGHRDCVAALLEAGASPVQYTPEGLGPVTLAARGGHREVVYMLLAAGGSPCEFADDGETPLFAAVEGGHPGVVKYILKCGEGTDGQNAEGAAPLMLAAQKGYLHIVKILLQFGAEVDFGDADGDAPLWAAAAAGHLGVVQMLVEAGADVDRERERGESALWIAAYNNHLPVVQYLISKGADVDSIDGKNVTPLLHAAACGKLELARVLIQAGANPAAVDLQGNSAVIHAVVGGWLEILKVLAQASGAVLDCKNLEGADAITIAQEERQWECATFLAGQLGVELPRWISSMGASPRTARQHDTELASGQSACGPVVESVMTARTSSDGLRGNSERWTEGMAAGGMAKRRSMGGAGEPTPVLAFVQEIDGV